MTIETFDYADGTDISTVAGYTVVNGSAEANSGRLKVNATSTDTNGGIFIVRDMGATSVTLSVDLDIAGGTYSPAGFAMRFVDVTNSLQLHYRSQDGYTRLVEKVNGTDTVIADATPSGFSSGDGALLEVADDGENISVLFNGSPLISHSTTVHQGSTNFGLWAAGKGYSFDNFSYPDAALPGLKQVNIELPTAFVGLGGVNYSLSNLITGEQVDYGSLATSSSPVNIQFENDNVASGAVLVAYASNISSGNDSEALVMWDKVTVSTVE